MQNIRQKQCNEFNKDFKNGPHQKILKKKEKQWYSLKLLLQECLWTLYFTWENEDEFYILFHAILDIV